MQNLADKIEIPMYDEAPTTTSGYGNDQTDSCAACGEKLFDHDAHDTSWQAWGAFWGITGMSSVELVCGACGEYLEKIFSS
jgi:hypothetical protein